MTNYENVENKKRVAQANLAQFQKDENLKKFYEGCIRCYDTMLKNMTVEVASREYDNN